MYVGVEQGTNETNEMKMIKYLQNDNESVFFFVRLLIGDRATVLSRYGPYQNLMHFSSH